MFSFRSFCVCGSVVVLTAFVIDVVVVVVVIVVVSKTSLSGCWVAGVASVILNQSGQWCI